MTKFYFWLNYIYSIFWMKITRKDKFSYRDQSRVHNWVVSRMTKASKRKEVL